MSLSVLYAWRIKIVHRVKNGYNGFLGTNKDL